LKYTEKERCINAAYAILARQPRTEKEMRDKLEKKEYSQEVIAEVIAALLEAALIDDVTYAVRYIINNQKRHGAYRLKQTLQRKGVCEADMVIAFEMAREEEAISEVSVACDLLRKKIAPMAIDKALYHEDYMYRQKTKAKLMRFLAGRGFSSEITNQSLKRVLDSEFIEKR